jgi:acyl carrier protein
MDGTDETSRKVIDIVARQLGLDPVRIKPESSFAKDLMADSLSMIEIILALEDSFGIEILDEGIDRIRTVGDAISHIELKEQSMSLYDSTTIGVVVDKTNATKSNSTSSMPPSEGRSRESGKRLVHACSDPAIAFCGQDLTGGDDGLKLPCERTAIIFSKVTCPECRKRIAEGLLIPCGLKLTESCG